MDLTCLPTEILLKIFDQPNLDVDDIRNLKIINKRFHGIISDSMDLWQKKFVSRWPRLHCISEIKDLNYEDLVKLRVMTHKTVVKSLSLLNRLCTTQQKIECITKLVKTNFSYPESKETIHYLLALFAEDDLLEMLILNKLPQSPVQINQLKCLHYIRTIILERRWQDCQKQLLKAAFFITQWRDIEKLKEPDIQYLKDLISNLVTEVKLKLSLPQLADQGNDEALKKINCINSVLFFEQGFRAADEDLPKPEDFFIEEVIQRKKGMAEIICIIYREVANQLELACELCKVGSTTLIRYATSSHDKFLNPANQGAVQEELMCGRIITPAEVVRDLVKALERCAHQILARSNKNHTHWRATILNLNRLMCTVSQDPTLPIFKYVRSCIKYKMQIEEAIILLKEFKPKANKSMDLYNMHQQELMEMCERILSECTISDDNSLLLVQEVMHQTPVKKLFSTN